MIRVEVSVLDDSAIRELPRQLNLASRDTLEQMLEQAARAAGRNLTPGGSGPNSRSGALRRSLEWRIYKDGDGYRGQFYSTSPYAAVHEHGAVIQAKRSEYLKFRVQGQWVQKRSVRIPARPFLAPAFEQSLEYVEDLLWRNLERRAK